MATKKKLLLLFFLLISLVIYSDSYQKLFKQAIDNYNIKDFVAAETIFNQLITAGYDNFEINYNLGCVHFKLNQFGQARFYFEKALILKPYHSELLENLNLVYQKIYEDPLSGEQEIMNARLVFSINIKVIAFMFLVSFISLLICLVLMIKTKNKLFVVLSVVCLSFIMVFTVFFYAQNKHVNQTNAIITDKKADLLLEPYSHTVISQLPTGFKARVVDSVEEYYKLQIPDGTSGWLKKDQVITNYPD
ncbi:MAG: tetratricopeptide repeat protein [Spirochaetes bacterium]|nr:tetratricopeptide repeat protein [Spirochaetota bacterium]